MSFPRGIPVELLDRYEEKFGHVPSPAFLETGTHAGWTIDLVLERSFFRQILTIELSDLHFGRAVGRFAKFPQVKLYHGSSRHFMGRMLADLNGPALIWLDAHYSAGDTASDGPGLECPVREELEAIRDSGVRDHVIAIDDMEDFIGGAYPDQHELRKMLREINDGYQITVHPWRRGVMIAEPSSR